MQVRDANGTVLGSATVAVNGTFSVTLAPAPTNGQTLEIVQVDVAGNTSSEVNLNAPDISPPAALANVVINTDGLTVTGNGEPGATVFVRNIGGTVLGSALVGANGGFSVTLSGAQLNAQLLTVNQEDPPGNEGPSVNVTAPDITPPATPDQLLLNATGLQVTGRGEAGSTITVSDANGRLLGTGTVGANGLFQLTLSEAQLNAQTLSVNARDTAGNTRQRQPAGRRPDATGGRQGAGRGGQWRHVDRAGRSRRRGHRDQRQRHRAGHRVRGRQWLFQRDPEPGGQYWQRAGRDPERRGRQ